MAFYKSGGGKMIKNTEKLKERIFNHPLFPKLKEKYPYRDYEFQWALMLDWWQTNKRKLPVYISAFDNWLKRTEIDADIKHEADRLENNNKTEQERIMMSTKPNEASLKKLDEMRKKWRLK